MTVSSSVALEGSIVVLPLSIANKVDELTHYSLPHPSNNRSKERVSLIESPAGEIFQLKTHEFSKGCSYNTQSDLANEKYHYTADEEPLKSAFFINEADRCDGHVEESGKFRIAVKYDITFNLIGFYYRNSVSETEKEYQGKLDTVGTTSPIQTNCFTVRDFQDFLIDNHDSEWSKVSTWALERALRKIAEPIEEAGDLYYKLTSDKITRCLAGKVSRMTLNLPKSIPLALDLPLDILECARIVMATNLLVSLIPKLAYSTLKEFVPANQDSDENLTNIKNSYYVYESYRDSLKCSIAEKELLVNAAMTVGLPSGKTKTIVTKKVTKKTVKVKKQTGAIDGFFKRAN